MFWITVPPSKQCWRVNGSWHWSGVIGQQWTDLSWIVAQTWTSCEGYASNIESKNPGLISLSSPGQVHCSWAVTGSADSGLTGRTSTLFMLLHIHTFTKCWSVTVTSLRRSWGTSRVLLSLCMMIQVSNLIFQGSLSSLSLRTKVETEFSCFQGQGMIKPVSFSD